MKPTRRGFLGTLIAGAVTPLVKRDEPITLKLDGESASKNVFERLPGFVSSRMPFKVKHPYMCFCGKRNSGQLTFDVTDYIRCKDCEGIVNVSEIDHNA